jgi:hypothetical protein
MTQPLRVYFATDLHGSEQCFQKFLRVHELYKADVLIMGGDVTGKQLIPIIRQSDGSYVSYFLEQKTVLKTEAEVEHFENLIRASGSYALRTDEDGYQELSQNPEKVSEKFEQVMLDSFAGWIRRIEEKLSNTGAKVYITGGNDDVFLINDILNKSSYVVNPDLKVLYIDERHPMASLGYGNITPWKCPRDVPEDELTRKIDTMVGELSSSEMSNCIFNFHVPPIDSDLDACIKLDTSVDPPKPMTKGGQPLMYGGGSVAVRQAIEKYQPMIGLHGHIHESKGMRKLGRTVCFNPGSEYGEGILRGLLLALDGKGLKSYLFTTL